MKRKTESAPHIIPCAFAPRRNSAGSTASASPRRARQSTSRWLLLATLCLTLMVSAVGCFGAIGGPIPGQDAGNTPDDKPSNKPDASQQDDPKITPDTSGSPDASQTDTPSKPPVDGGPDQPGQDQPPSDGDNKCGDAQSNEPLPQDIYFDDVVKDFLQEFCVKCHDSSNQSTGSLAEYNNANRGALTNKPKQFWQKAYDRIHHTDKALQMPPAGSLSNACKDIERFKYGVRLFDEWAKRGFPYDASGSTPNQLEPTPTPAQFPSSATCKGKEPLPARLWRLTSQQVGYSLKDVFEDKLTIPAFAFDYTNGERRSGFSNDAAKTSVNAKSMSDLIQMLQGLSTQVIDKIQPFKDCITATNSQARTCARKLIADYGLKLWRRPLTQTEIDDIYNALDRIEGDPAGSRRDAIAFIVERLIFSPYFLYRSEMGQPAGQPGLRQLTSYEVASFLSYTVWQSVPDAALLAAAAKDELTQRANIVAQLNRMLQDTKAQRGTREYFSDWLRLNKVLQLTAEDSQRFGILTNAMKQDMKKETELLLNDVVWQRKGDLEDLFTTNQTFANTNIAKLYKLSLTSSTFKPVQLPKSQRAGILTTPAFLVSHGTANSTKFVLRGVFALEGLLCKHVPAPPDDAVSQGEERLKKNDISQMTTREAQEKIHSQGSCMSCHKDIDPLGAAFEMFDPIGRFRISEKTPSGTSKPIDAAGKASGFTDLKPDFQNAVELIGNLAQSEHLRKCFSIKLFTYQFGQELSGAQSCEVAKIYDYLKGKQFRLSEVYRAIVETENFLYRKEPAQTP